MYFRRLRSNRITDMEMNYMNNYSQTLKASLGNLRNDSGHEYGTILIMNTSGRRLSGFSCLTGSSPSTIPYREQSICLTNPIRLDWQRTNSVKPIQLKSLQKIEMQSSNQEFNFMEP
jgi:hypothetical protein